MRSKYQFVYPSSFGQASCKPFSLLAESLVEASKSICCSAHPYLRFQKHQARRCCERENSHWTVLFLLLQISSQVPGVNIFAWHHFSSKRSTPSATAPRWREQPLLLQRPTTEAATCLGQDHWRRAQLKQSCVAAVRASTARATDPQLKAYHASGQALTSNHPGISEPIHSSWVRH